MDIKKKNDLCAPEEYKIILLPLQIRTSAAVSDWRHALALRGDLNTTGCVSRSPGHALYIGTQTKNRRVRLLCNSVNLDRMNSDIAREQIAAMSYMRSEGDS